MLKHRRKLRQAAIAAAGAAALATVGITAAAAAPSASGTEHFQTMTTSDTAKTSSIIGYGVFTQGGTVSGTNGSSSKSTVTFPNGTFVITHSKGTGTVRFNPKTCLFQISRKGTYTLGSGTGAYAHLTGSGTYKFSILGVAARSGGKCANPQTTPAAAYQQTINASGPVSLR